MARRRGTVDTSDELGDIEAWYRRRLTARPEPRTLPFQPVFVGPTWQQTDDGLWRLPDLTLGWLALAWCGRWLQVTPGMPWVFTEEQARFILWWYALTPAGSFVYRDGVLQRLKGWGKDPIMAAIAAFELLGPARVADLDGGRPVGRDVPEAWIQTAAVSIEQTKNTMRLFPGLFSAEAKARFRIQPGKEKVYALAGERLIEAVTSSPATLEGGRPTFTGMNETQHWDSSNSGHDMADVIERNATKSADGASRTLRITNAFEPGMDSVAERDRDAYDQAVAGVVEDTGQLYDSLEAPPEAPLLLEAAPAVLLGVRGDSVWLNVDRIVQSIADPRNPPSRSRRFWYNQITAAEDAWLTPQTVDDCELATETVDDGVEIVAFFDGSKSDDATGIVGCRVRDGVLFTIGVWQKPPGERGKGWIVPRGEVDARVEDMFRRYKVAAFWADPSHTKDDDGERFWDALVDGWHQRYGKKIDRKLWAVQAGDNRSAIAWDMASSERTASFTAAAERFVADAELGNVRYVADEPLKQQLKNARRRPNKTGISLGKEHRESAKKVDLAVCAVGARMLHRILVNHRAATARSSGKVW